MKALRRVLMSLGLPSSGALSKLQVGALLRGLCWIR